MSINEKTDEPFGTADSFHPNNGKEAEAQRRGSTTLPDGRKMSRIGPPPGALKVTLESDTQDEISRLLELEAGNAIKYRTCSWQKVIVHPLLPSRVLQIPYGLRGMSSIHHQAPGDS
jgi:hypothetical protein